MSLLPPPRPLSIHSCNAVDRWRNFEHSWNNYCVANELDQKSEPVQVATLLTVIGEEARAVYSSFDDWENEGDEYKIQPVLNKYSNYCHNKNGPFKRLMFSLYKHQQAGSSIVV